MSDPPIGVNLGTTLSGAPTVIIGGVPTPFTGASGLSAAIKAFFLEMHHQLKAQAAKAMVARVLAAGSIVIAGDEEYKAKVEADLLAVASTPEGRARLQSILESGHTVVIQNPYETDKLYQFYDQVGANATPADPAKAMLLVDGSDDGPFVVAGRESDITLVNTPDGLFEIPSGTPVAVLGPGEGSDTTISYSPEDEEYENRSSHATLNHELAHAEHNANGTNMNGLAPHGADDEWYERHRNLEEESATQDADNTHRRQSGLPERRYYTDEIHDGH